MTNRDVFSGIADRYDRLNTILSLGRDQAWRRSVLAHLPPGPLLDLGAGTGAANALFGDREVVALDPAREMLALNEAPGRVIAVGERLPFVDHAFDGVFSAYVFRNLDSVAETLAEVARVLAPGGKLGVVDLGRPIGALSRGVHRLATGVTLPIAGAAIGAREEYTYLHRSLDEHPGPDLLMGPGPLRVERTWRMGPLGFVWGAILSVP